MDAVKAWGEVDENPREGSWGVGGDTAAAISDTHGDVEKNRTPILGKEILIQITSYFCTIV